MPPRRRAALAGLIGGVLLLALGAGAFAWLGAALRAKLSAVASQSGLRLRIGGLSLARASVTLERVVLDDPTGRRPTATAQQVQLYAPPLDVARHGVRAIRAASVRGFGAQAHAATLAGVDCEVSAIAGPGVRIVCNQKDATVAPSGWDLRVLPSARVIEGEVTLRAFPFDLVRLWIAEAIPSAPRGGRLDLDLRLHREGPERVAIVAVAHLRGAAYATANPAAGPDAVPELSFSTRARWVPRRRRVEVPDAALSIGSVALGLHGIVELGDGYRVADFQLRVPPTPCAELARVFREPSLLNAARPTATASGLGRMRVDSRNGAARLLEIPYGACGAAGEADSSPPATSR
jgi:hypothetical protein